MVLIKSIQNEQTTCDVIDWLLYYGNTVIRINEDEKITDLQFSIDSKNKINCIVTFGNRKINLSNVSSFWFRKGEIDIDIVIHSNSAATQLLKEINEHLSEECICIKQFLHFLLKNKKNLGSYYKKGANKLISLYVAQSIGLKTPQTLISSKRDELSAFYNSQTSCITKSIQDVLCFNISNEYHFTSTSIVTKNEIDQMDNSFFPSQLQENIPKRYELRIFYLLGEFYSMAIFSQQDEQTQVDFRNYNNKKPNRNVPFKLPSKIESKLDLFMKKMNLDTGSIDMIVTPELEYIFLEVNPVGQYDMVSVPCNYYLHEKIAKFLNNGK